MALLGLGIAAAAGLAKSQFVDKPKEQKQRALAASTQRYSPWTGLQAQPVQNADPFGSALQYGATGAAIGNGMQNANSQATLSNALAANPGSAGAAGATAPMINGGSPWSMGSYNFGQPKY